MQYLNRLAFAALLVAGATARAEEPKPRPERPAASSFTCAGKRTCGQMASCEEAKFYLEHCGRARLDGDKDGIPCESLCRR
jgi:hypothetical protein